MSYSNSSHSSRTRKMVLIDIAVAIIAAVVVAFVFMWHFYLWWKPLPFVFCYGITAVCFLATVKASPIKDAVRLFMCLLFFASCVLQLLVWFGLTDPGVFAR